jgi:Fe-S-cluster containining protein
MADFRSLSSGLPELIAEELSSKRSALLLELIEKDALEELKMFFMMNPHLIDSSELKAIKIYTKLVMKETVYQSDISMTEIKDFLADALAKEIAKIHHKLKKELDFSSLKEFLPRLDEYLNKAPEQKVREESVSYKLKMLETKTIFDQTNYQEKLSEIYNEISEIQNQVAEASQIDKETCFKANCCDCCVYTPPLVTKLEFEYIKANVDIEPFKKKALENQVKHQMEFATKFELIDLNTQSKEEMNPNNLPHRCPFLEDSNACAIHEHRPFACRFYGLSTLDGETVQACNYYLEQFPKEERSVLDSRSATQLLGKANKELCNGKQVAGTLTAWLSNS